MQKLTNKEEEIMQVLWKLEKAYIKEMLEEFQEEKPHYNTVATIIKILEEKGFVSHKSFGNSHRYFPLISKEEYRENFMEKAVESYFNNSYRNIVSMFVKEQKINADDLRRILKMIEDNE
jgi:BlaI family penicillinase repressor